MFNMKRFIALSISVLIFILLNSSYGQHMILDSVRAQQGDGIFKLLREHGYDPGEHIDNFIKMNKDKIVNENQLIAGEFYVLPSIDDTLSNQTQHYLDSLVRSQFAIHLQEDSISIEKDSTEYVEVELDSDYFFTETSVDISEDSIEETLHTVTRTFPDINADKWKLRYADSVKSDKLKGALIYIVSGHGGPDPGAVATVDGYQISEDEYAYDISLRLAKNIEENGGKVIMIIKDPYHGIRNDRILPMDQNEYCYPDLDIPLNHIARLKQRVDAVNEIYRNNTSYSYQRLVELHLDSRSTGTGVDVFFYHYTKSTTGREFANTIRDVFDQKYARHQPNRGYSGTVSGRNLYVIRRTIPPAILIELGNIQNSRDQRRFLDHNNRQALANWITEGIINDFENNKSR